MESLNIISMNVSQCVSLWNTQTNLDSTHPKKKAGIARTSNDQQRKATKCRVGEMEDAYNNKQACNVQ